MTESPFPPLRPDALERLPAALEQVRTFWQTMAQAAAVVEETLPSFDPEAIPADLLGLWIWSHMQHLRETWTAALKVYNQFQRLQVLEKVLVDYLVEDIEDHAAPTD
jgi:hypothetical protein